MNSFKSSNKPQKDKFDCFFTKKEIVLFLLKEIDLSLYKCVIEPSAGDGAFSDEIENCVALDIEPKNNKIIKCNFFDFIPDKQFSKKSVLVIGNPPFGKLGSKALKFFKKSAEFSDTIAFILPRSFKKESMKKRIPKTFHLLKEIVLPDNSFLFNNHEYSVPTVFQIWKNLNKLREDFKKVSPIDFFYTKKENADIAIRRVGIYAGRASAKIEDKSSQSHNFIKFMKFIDIEKFISIFNKIEWETNNTTGPKSISKNEINEKLNQIIKEIT